jgi:localization factor PodJL
MRPGVPWNIKDISPEAREAAQVAATRAGLTLGEWLSQAIAQEAKTLAAHEAQAAQRQPYRPQSPAPAQTGYAYPQQQFAPPQQAAHSGPEPVALRFAQANGAEPLHAVARNSEFTIVAHGLRDLADRLESTERRQTQAITAINQNVAAMADKVDAADRIKTMAETAFATAADAINQSTRDQAAAFESLEKTVTAMNSRLETVESAGQNDKTARETLLRLETTLDGFKSRLSDAERRGVDAQSSLENWVKTLNTRIEQTGLETSEAIRASSTAMERNLDSVRTGLAEQERRAQDRAEAMATIQNGLLAIRTEITETDKRARDGAAGLEKWIKELSVKLDQANPAAEIQRLAHGIESLRQEARAAAESVAAEAVVREKLGTDLRTQLDAAVGRLTTQIAQAEARGESTVQGLRETLDSAASAGASGASPETDDAIQSLQQAVERLSMSVANSDQANAQTAQRQAAAIRKVEDMLQGFARGLDSIGDVSKGPLSQPMSAVQATLETITAKIEESDSRAAESVATVETALKVLAGRIDDSEKRQAQTSAQIEASLRSMGERLDTADLREKDLHQKLEDSFRDVLDRIEDSERKAADSVEAVEAGMGTINQRLDAADRRHKESIAGLRLTVDGLVAKAAAEPLLQRPFGMAQSLAPQPLTATPPAAAYAASPVARAPEPPPSLPAPVPALAAPLVAPEPTLPPQPEMFAPPPLRAPEPEPPAFEAPPFETQAGPDEDSNPKHLDEPPAPSFEDLLAQAPQPDAQQLTRGPLPPLEQPAPPKRADDFLAQARRAAQAAALADAQAQAAAAATPKNGRVRKTQTDPYAPEGERSIGRIAVAATVLLALIVGAIALIVLAPWRSGADEVNRPAPGSSLGEMMSADQPQAAADPQVPAATTFTELSPPPEAEAVPDAAIMTVPASSPELEAPAPGAPPLPESTPAPAAAGNDALKALEASAQRGDVKAQYLMSKRLSEGSGVARDPAKSLEWLRRSAQGGFPVAQYQLAMRNERGSDGVGRDLVQARVWYEKAAVNGNRKAMHNLAVLHAEGVGTPQNMPEAAKWFQRGAEFGLTDSQYNLGILYERGLGVATNKVEAAKWFAIAAAQGDADAAVKLQAMRAGMSPADANRALDSARAFQPKAPSATANDLSEPGN